MLIVSVDGDEGQLSSVHENEMMLYLFKIKKAGACLLTPRWVAVRVPLRLVWHLLAETGLVSLMQAHEPAQVIISTLVSSYF